MVAEPPYVFDPLLGRVLALDLGERRIGVAVSDEGRAIAMPLMVLARTGRDKDVAAIAGLTAEQEATLLVIGLTRNADDSLAPMGERALRLGKRLARVIGIPVAYVDEFETTVQAREAMLEGKASRATRRNAVDKLAAALILRRYLDGLGREEKD
jgi:putative Holliday junction resolvase